MQQHRDVRSDLSILGVCAAALLLSVMLQVDREGHVLLPYTGGPPMPGTCLTRQLLHIDCPGCGMTRSFVAMADGEFNRAYAFHRLGPLLFVYVLLQVPLRAYALLTGRPGLLVVLWRYSAAMMWALIVALMANWGYNVVTGAALH